MISLQPTFQITVTRWARRVSTAVVLAITAVAAMAFSISSADAQCALASGSVSGSGSGWVGGAQAGYNWQQGTWVYGLEADLSGSGLKTSLDGLTTVGTCGGAAANATAKVDWFGTARGRVGWAVDNLLFYGTGGLAYGHVNLDSIFADNGVTLNASTSSVRAGWVAGAGVEYQLRPDLTLTLGYQYVDLGSVGFTASSPRRYRADGERQHARGVFGRYHRLQLALPGGPDQSGDAVARRLCRRPWRRRMGAKYRCHIWVGVYRLRHPAQA